MLTASRSSPKKSWQTSRQRVSVLAELAIKKETVSRKLAELREAHNLTQERAAAHVGVTMRQWQRWEGGASVPYPRNLDAIAEKFGIGVQEFFDEPRSPTGNGAGETQLDRIERMLTDARDEQQRISDIIESAIDRQFEILDRLENAIDRDDKNAIRADEILGRLDEAAAQVVRDRGGTALEAGPQQPGRARPKTGGSRKTPASKPAPA